MDSHAFAWAPAWLWTCPHCLLTQLVYAVRCRRCHATNGI
jgi:hypothetical protein